MDLSLVRVTQKLPINGRGLGLNSSKHLLRVFEVFTNGILGQEACRWSMARHTASFLRPEMIVILQNAQDIEIFLTHSSFVLNTSNNKD